MRQLAEQVRSEEKFMLNDLRFWVWAFDQFIGDVRDLIPNADQNVAKQFNLENLNYFLQQEFELDAEYQRNWWLYHDRAAEALPLLESDGPEHYQHPITGFKRHMDMEKVREHAQEDAYINLIGSNVDRKLGDMSNFNPNFYAEPLDPKHADGVDTLNHYVRHIKDNNDFDTHFNNIKYEMIAIGSGCMQIGHGTNYNSSELGLLKHYIRQRKALTPSEVQRFSDVFEYHKLRYWPSFNVVRYRGASGPKSKSFKDPMHKHLHFFEHMSVVDARNRYPDYAHNIRPGLDRKALELSPELSLIDHEVNDLTTIIHERIRFPVREMINIPILGGNGKTFQYSIEQPRYAVGSIVRCTNGGILDMKLDYYEHGFYDMVQIVNYPSFKHSCGIGTVKFGRDLALVHNQLHNGALRYFGTQLKGGGYYFDEIVADDDLKQQSRGNRWVKINIAAAKKHMGHKQRLNIGDFIKDRTPPDFPSAWANLMKMEEEALDRSMRSGGAWRGERVGYSGLQQSIASQDASMMHTGTHQELKNCIKEMAELTFHNIIQFDGDRYIKFAREDKNGDTKVYELNEPQDPIDQFDENTGMYHIVPAWIRNHVGSMNFHTRIEPESILPKAPFERANFFLQLLQTLTPFVKDPHARIMLRGFQTEGMRIPGLNKSMDNIDQYDKEMMNLQAQLQEIDKEYQKLLDDREFAKDKAEINQNLLRLTHKFVADMTRSNPTTLQQLLGGRQKEVTAVLLQAIQGLLTGEKGGIPTLPALTQPGQMGGLSGGGPLGNPPPGSQQPQQPQQ